MKKILVIEDDLKHLENAKKLCVQFPQFEFIFATTLREALGSDHMLNPGYIKQFDAIITDLHFPLGVGGEPQQIGITIAMIGRFLGKPIAIVSDIEKHSKSIMWMREIWSSFNGRWHFGEGAEFPWLFQDSIAENKVSFLPETYKTFRDIYNPGNDGKKPYVTIVGDLIAYWDK